MQNLLDVAQEVERRDLTKGGTVNQNLILSSSSRVQGDVVFNASVTSYGLMTLSAAQLVGGGLVRQYVSSTTVGYYNFAAIQIPGDDTIPQLSEGYKILTATITAKNASSKLLFTATINVGEHTNNCDAGALCVFKDSTADALACNIFDLGASGTHYPARLHYVASAVDVSSHYYTLTIGSFANLSCIEVNGAGGVRVLGGALISTFQIVEFEGR